MATTPTQRRLAKELSTLLKDPTPCLHVNPADFDESPHDDQEPQQQQNHSNRTNNIITWRIGISGPPNSLYDGERFTLIFRFSQKYPFESPEVVFSCGQGGSGGSGQSGGGPPPVHPHVYSNGHICLSILTEDWSPALSVQSVCLSIVSMLGSATEKKRPPDDALYVKTCSKNPKKTRWWYHDDSV